MAHRTLALLATLVLVASLAAAGAQAGSSKSSACKSHQYSYAGLESVRKAHGVSATLAPTAAPKVVDGHVAGWIGVGGAGGAGGSEWLQVGIAAVTADRTSRMYYEVTGSTSKSTYHELDTDVSPGEKHHFSVLEMSGRTSWWRVWVDGRPVSPPIHLPGSHGAWYPQAIAENFNGAHGTCNGYSYEFSDLAVARTSGGAWQPFESGYVFQDRGYRIVRGASPTRFVATSL